MNVIFGKAYVYHNNNMFYVVKVIREEYNPVVNVWKEHLHCDTVLKKDGLYYFCRLVPELEVIEDEQI